MSETIQLTETSRLVIEQDTDAENPTTWGNHVTEGDDIHTAWADGEVYGVILERAKVYTAEDGSTLTNWEDSDSLWGCYLSDDYTAQTVALEHFELNDSERAALGLDTAL